MALGIHPKDGRKIDRACEYFNQTGQKLSQLHSSRSYISRYANVSVVFIDFDKAYIHDRIRSRFNKMLMDDECILEFEKFYEENKGWILNENK